MTGLLRSLALALLAGLITGSAKADDGSGESSWPAWARSLESELAPLARLADGADRRWAGRPVRHTSSLGIPADGRQDATDALQAALDAMAGGGTLVLDPGLYRQTRCLHLTHAHLRLLGTRGARMHASNPHDMCIALEGDHEAAQGLTLTAAPAPRASGIAQARIVVHGTDALVADNTIVGATSGAVWVQGAHRYAVVGNRISDTNADGIHQSEGATDGYVARNTLVHTGDDGIAVVSYLSSARSTRVLIEDNVVRDARVARGIAVMGSEDVLVRRNRVDGTGRAAGIVVSEEPTFETYGTDRVVLADNWISGVATLPAQNRTGHASIDLNALGAPVPSLSVHDVLAAGNTIRDGATGGIRLLGNVAGVSLLDNDIHRMGGSSILVVDQHGGPALALCRGNQVDPGSKVPPACSDGTSQ